jgi:Domain of unknown function (DUF4153)
MRLPSIEQASREARDTLVRFPFALLASAVAAVAMLAMIERTGPDRPYGRMILPALTAIPLLVALATTMERRQTRPPVRLAVRLAATVIPLLMWFVSKRWTDVVMVTHYVHLDVAFHLMAATLPFAGFAAGRAFWHYNRILFLRFLLATLYAAVLFAGLAVALLAIDKLFNLHVDDNWYFRLLVVLIFVFHPWYFLGGVPRDMAQLDERTDYPGGLKIFAQFILIPVVTVYLLILTAYLVRVVVTRTWPSGWIGYLVSSVAAAGTLALLLVHPVRERADSRWVDAYGRWFYVLLLPSVAMLLMAIWQRVGQYGITERRYFLAVLALWLAGIALFYAVTASRNIRLIPVSLCLVALGTFTGPWSAYTVSRSSQARRLSGILVRNELLSGGEIHKAVDPVAFEDRKEISATIRYLVSTHGSASLRRVSRDMAAVADSMVRIDSMTVTQGDPIARAVMNRMGLEYVTRYEAVPQDWLTYYANNFGVAVPVTGFDYVVRTNLIQRMAVATPGDSLILEFAPSPPRLTISRGTMTPLVVPLSELLDRARQSMETPVPGANGNNPPIVLDAEGNGLRVQLRVWNVSGRGEGTEAELNSAEADVLVAIARGSSPSS